MMEDDVINFHYLLTGLYTNDCAEGEVLGYVQFMIEKNIKCDFNRN